MKIYLKALQNGEYIQFLNDVLVIVQENSLVHEDLKTNIEQLSAQIIKLDKVFNIRGHVLTSKIKEADAKRDQAFIGLKNVVKGYQSHSNVELVEQADQVMHLIRRIGLNVSDLNYRSETESLRVLIQELEVLESEQSTLTNLGIKAWVEDLKELNEAFNELHLLRTLSKADTGVHSVTSMRKETDKLYNALVDLLNAVTLTKKSRNKPVDAYEKAQERLTMLIKENMDSVQLRKSRIQKDDLDDAYSDSNDEEDHMNGEE